MWLGCEWRHTRKRWTGKFAYFWKKQLVEIRTWARPVQLWSMLPVCWVSQFRFWLLAESSAEGLTEKRCRSSQHSKNCVFLSSCRKPESQEGNKSFVPEQRKSSVFRDSYASEYFTYPYSYIAVFLFSYILRTRNMDMLQIE